MLIVALAALVLVAAPLTGMVVYRSLHPVYIYHLTPPTPAAAPVKPAPSPAENNSKPTKKKPGPAAHKQPAAQQTPAGVWPPQPQR